MSKYFVLPENCVGPGGDIVFRHDKAHAYIHNVWVGDVFFGQAFNMGRAWSAVSWNVKPSEFFMVNNMQGFATRFDAATFIVKHHGYWMFDERRRLV